MYVSQAAPSRSVNSIDWVRGFPRGWENGGGMVGTSPRGRERDRRVLGAARKAAERAARAWAEARIRAAETAS